ncbi:MAG: SurA N-terminal domain-containing protein [Dehalococcoidia bacterium]|nr:SurA N-terminal domain-containing protein [Dehalococcoidia bacterium]
MSRNKNKAANKKSKLVPTKRQLSKWQSEERRRRIILSVVVAVIVCVVGLASYSVYGTEVKPWHETVIRVNGDEVDMRYYVTALRIALNGKEEAQEIRSIIPTLTDQIVESKLVVQSAAEYGITVTADEVSGKIREITLGANGVENGNDADFDSLYKKQLDRFDLSDAEYRDIVRNSMLQDRVVDYIGGDIPDVAPQIHLYVMQLASEEEAQDARQRLDNGIEFAEIAASESLDPSSEAGGDVGWIVKGMIPDMDEVAFSLDIGEVSEPFHPENGQGYYLLKVSEKDEAKELTDAQHDVLQSRIMLSWMKEQKDASDIEIMIDADMYPWIEKHVY